MADGTTGVTELRIALTVDDFDAAVAFYRDHLGPAQLEDWSSDTGRVVLLDGVRATLELLDADQARTVDLTEAGRRVAEPVTTPWGDRNARLRTPDGLQLTLFTPGDPPVAEDGGPEG